MELGLDVGDSEFLFIFFVNFDRYVEVRVIFEHVIFYMFLDIRGEVWRLYVVVFMVRSETKR